MEDIYSKGLELLEKAKSLPEPHRMALNYFIENLSVGSLRSVKELKVLGVDEPEKVLEELVERGFLEEGLDCYNLARPLRELVFRRGRIRV